ncbi:glycoside hydrolase family 18 protein [Sphaerobolus stellatus SS14]|nr:glycoside hydrolase family 18 protein [Sphaerobolus stellatus SS14]
MVTISRFLTVLSILAASLSAVTAAAVTSAPDATTSLAKRGVSSAPHFVVYWDTWISGENGPPDPSNFKGYNTVMLTFLLSSGTADQAAEWASLSNSDRSSIKKKYNDAGIKLMVSAFGATDTPTSSGQDASSLAKSMADWVKKYNLDGIDVDYEDFDAVNAGTATDWLATFTSVLRDNLPQGEYAISHAPLAPWFSSGTGSPYTKLHKKVGDKIDFYNVQFYNQGNLYEDCGSLVSSSGGGYPGSSIMEIANQGIDSSKIVAGKVATQADAYSGGYIDPSTLAGCVAQAKNKGWNGGVMAWQYPNADSNWIKTVRSQAWPV